MRNSVTTAARTKIDRFSSAVPGFDYTDPVRTRGMRLFMWDGMFMGALETIVLNYLPLFAFAYGASNGQIGLLAAAASLGAATSSLPGAWLSARWRHRKPFILLTRSGLAHVLLVALALLPLIGPSPLLIGLVIAVATGRSFVMYMAEGPWASLAADLVPVHVRNRFFGMRNFMVGAGGLAGIGAVALMLAGLGPGTEWTAVWGFAAGAGVVSTLLYSRIPEKDLSGGATRPTTTDPGAVWGPILHDRMMQRYLFTVLLWNVSIYTAGPFFNVHLVKNLGASDLWVGGLLVVAAVSGLAGQLYFLKKGDGRTARSLIPPCGFIATTLPIAWFFVTDPWQVIAINVVAGVVWAGYLLATFNFLLSLSPEGKERYYAGAYTTVIFLSMAIGPLVGGALASVYGIKAVFLASGAGRLISMLLFVRLIREEPAPEERPARSPRRVPAVAPGR